MKLIIQKYLQSEVFFLNSNCYQVGANEKSFFLLDKWVTLNIKGILCGGYILWKKKLWICPNSILMQNFLLSFIF